MRYDHRRCLSKLDISVDLPFEVGALYSRRSFIHAHLGGQQQGGISTPSKHPIVIAFTGEAGSTHGYRDFWDDEEIFHYFGEGQVGDMRYAAGNRAIEEHVKDGKRLIIFQMMGKGRPARYLGEFQSISSYIQRNTPDTLGQPRSAIIFRLKRLFNRDAPRAPSESSLPFFDDSNEVGETSTQRLVDVRTKQRLFRERLIGFERGCRLTGVEDLRFLRASHIKPWSFSGPEERVDGQNGLLLTPHADHLFDRGWISFRDNGTVLVSDHLPTQVRDLLCMRALSIRQIPALSTRQRDYMSFHRDAVFESFTIGKP